MVVSVFLLLLLVAVAPMMSNLLVISVVVTVMRLWVTGASPDCPRVRDPSRSS